MIAVTGEFPMEMWAYVIVPLVLYVAVVLALAGAGTVKGAFEMNFIKLFFKLISNSLQRLTGFPGWAMAGVLSGLFVLGLAVFGLYWDVAWHIDLGRDRELFTPPHVMIVLGLGGLVYSAVVSVIFASVDEAPVGLRRGRVRVPYSSIALAVLGAGGLVAFPLDNLWHQAYGLDVTLWSPTHLQLVAGGGLATLALWLMIAEARGQGTPNWFGRAIHVLVAGAALVALTTFQGEFDYGVPQFQALYLPLLIAGASGFALVAARLALGPGGALKALLAYLILRVSIAIFVAGMLNHTLPRFPLYLAAALCVEAAALTLGTSRRLRFALVSGLAIGTGGTAGESVWIEASGWFHSTSPALLPKVALLAPLAAVSMAILGAGFGRAFSPGTRVSRRFLALGALGIIVAMAYPLPRNTGQVAATIRLHQDRQMATVEVQLEPPDAAQDATAFAVVAWQGGGRTTATFDEVGPGHYLSSGSVPVYGAWKTVVSLQRGDEVMAAGVHLPADPQIGASAVTAEPVRHVVFQQNTKVLLREAHDGPAWPAVLAYTGLALLLTIWSALLMLAVVRTRPPADERPIAAAGRPRVAHALS